MGGARSETIIAMPSKHPSLDDLVHARDDWTAHAWALHFQSLDVRPSPVRYDTGGANDVLRFALNKAQKGRCW